MRKLRFDLLMPFLLAIYPVVYLYHVNYFRVDPLEVIVAGIISLLAAALLLGVTRLLLRDSQRSLFVTGWLVLLFFTFGHTFTVFQSIRIRYFPFDKLPNLLALWALLAVVGVIFAIKASGRLSGINRFIGLFSSFLLIVALGDIGLKVASGSAPPPVAFNQVLDVQKPDKLRDIYYIILDEYAGNGFLLDYLGYDNRAFTDSLKDRGFFLVEDARSNYYATVYSLASSLNMRYLDDLYGHRGEDQQPLVNLIRNNVSVQTLKQLGYTYIHFASKGAATRENPFADILYNGYDEKRIKLGNLIELDPRQVHITDFHLTLGQTTLLLPLMETVELNDSRVRNLYNFEKLAEIPAMPEPTFTFAHLVIPHKPFVFGLDDGPKNPNGREVDGEVVDQEKYEPYAGYVDQIVFTNRAVSELVDTILSLSATEPIILIQGDHGFRGMCSDCLNEVESWDAAYYANIMLPVLSAYYLPDDGVDELYPTISPVNSFRLIFDHYFGANLGLLEDRYFRPEDYYRRPYFYVEITDTVQETQSRH